ncbi:MAG: glycogen/starch synthase [Acidimicrobiales bacterium]
MPSRSADQPRVLFATAELSPIARVGGLAEAAAGLTTALEHAGVDVEVVLPDYDNRPLDDEMDDELDVPSWVGSARARRGSDASGRVVTLIDAPTIARPHPYLDPATGEGWVDNDHRFAAFCAAVAAITRLRAPDVLHLNDWHTGLALGMLDEAPPTVLTIHTIAYQGITSSSWLDRLAAHRAVFEWFGGTNPLAGAIALVDRVIAVSPTYAREIVTPELGVGLHHRLQELGDRLVGIRNGIDTNVWDPSSDPYLAARYSAADPMAKRACRAALLEELGWSDDGSTIVGMVTRLADQKGVDLALDAARFLADIPARFVLLGAGDKALAERAHEHSALAPTRVAFVEGYDNAFGHRIFAGSDLFLMPSRFEPCGLAQMQAMAYGTVPVTTDVGGLHDTVIDDDRERGNGNGFVSRSVDGAGMVDALHRAARAVKQPARRRALQRRGMSTDWSWTEPAQQHIALYRDMLTR